MKTVLLYIILLFSMLHYPAMSEEANLNSALLKEIENKTLRPFFNALKNGNMEVLKRYMTGAMYEEFKVALDVDIGYPGSIREHYKNAIFSVEGGRVADNMIIVDVGIEFPVIGKKITQFYLQEQDIGRGSGQQVVGERLWRIGKQRIE